jgi:hypothetical protein
MVHLPLGQPVQPRRVFSGLGFLVLSAARAAAPCAGTNVCSGYGCGTVFSLTPGGNGYAEKVLYSFDGTHGGLPVVGLTVKGTELYGATLYGGEKLVLVQQYSGLRCRLPLCVYDG